MTTAGFAAAISFAISSRMPPNPLAQDVAQVHKADGIVQPGGIEKGELLLIPQHFQGGLTEHGEVERRSLWCGICKDELMRHRGLPAPRRASDDVEGELGEAPTENLVEAGDPRW